MATCLNDVITNMYKNISIGDVMCPVCRGIFIEPVVMPCYHGLCLQCFQRTMEETSLTCPMCRKRIGSWLRTATKDHNLVDNELWAIIQKRFPKQVKAKLNGEEDGIEAHIGRVSPRISCPGEIRREYELHVIKLEEEARKKRDKERRASEELIRKIQEEDERHYFTARQHLLDQTAADEQIARELQEQSSQSSSGNGGVTVKKEISGLHVGVYNKENKRQDQGSVGIQIKGPMDSYVISLKNKSVSSGQFLAVSDSGCNELERVHCTSSMSTGSHDSINQEMHHFKPIKSVPRTPPKKLSDGRVLVPMVMKAIPENLSTLFESLDETSSAEPFVRKSCRQQLVKVQMEQMRNLKGVLRTSETNPPISAFKGRGFFWQKTEPLKLASDSSEKKQTAEDMESPRKKACRDVATEGRKSNFMLAGLSSYSEEECRGKKVITILHNHADSIVEVEGKIGGHDRRFGGSEEEENCAISLVDRMANRNESDNEQDYSDSDVSQVTRVQPESCSQTETEIRYQTEASALRGYEMSSSSGVNLKINLLSINPTKKTSADHSRNTHTLQNNIKRVYNNNTNSHIKSAILPKMLEKTEAPAVFEKKKENVAEKCKDSFHNDISVISDTSLMLSLEQAQVEMLIKQEQADFELAVRLQHEWDIADRRVDRSKGSLRAYELRNSSKSKTTKKNSATKKEGRGRQSTLEESFTGALHSARKRNGHHYNS